MKRHKAPGLSGLVVQMTQATGDIGTPSRGLEVKCATTNLQREK